MMRYCANQRAVGLVEILLVLSVVAVITLVSVRYFVVAKRAAKVSTTVSMVGDVVEASYTWVRGQPNFATISMTALTSNGYLPAKWSDGTKINPWGGNITVVGTNNNTQIRVTVTGIQVSDASGTCTNLLAKLNQRSSVAGSCTTAGSVATYQGTF